MSAIIEPDQDMLERTSVWAHTRCVVCGRAAKCGLGLQFRLRESGGVEADFRCAERHQGYAGILHGGIASSLLDGAMTNCLFARGIVAVTAEMKVRFRHPVRLEAPLVVRARVLRCQKPLHVVEGEIVQGGQVKVRAEGKFMERPVQ